MRMSFGQEMRMAQKQVLAPRMIQSMEILQLPVMALEERIEEEIQNNETLEMEEAGQEAPMMESVGPVSDAEPTTIERTVDEKPLIVDQDHANQADFERTYDWATEYPDSDDDRSRPSASQIEQAGDRYLDVMANMAERPETLCDHLHGQLSNYDLTDAERSAADKVIYNLDANGYLPMPLEDLVEADGPPEQITHLYKALAAVQNMDPPGVGARDLKECLLLQIRHDIPNARNLRRLVSSHLEDLAGNRLPVIVRKTGLSLEQIEQLREQLHLLKPKPGAIFSSPIVVPVKPDVYVDQPLSRVDLPLDVLAGAGVGIGRHQHVAVDRADAQVGQVDFLEPHLPGAVGLLVDIHVGLHRHDDRRAEDRARLRLERMQLLAELLDLLDREARLPLDHRESVPRQIFQVTRHKSPQVPGVRRVVADLEQQALLEIASPDPGRIHVLYDRERLVEVGDLIRGTIRIDEILEWHRQVAVGVEVVDHFVGGGPLHFGEFVVGDLGVEVIAERLRPLSHVGHDVEIPIAGLLDLRSGRAAAIVVTVGVFVGPIVGPLEVCLVRMILVDDQRLLVDGPFDRRRLGIADEPHRLRDGAVLPGLLHLERLVVLDLLLDPLLQRHHRQLQDFHRLDHARRKHLLLRHPHFLAERHPHCSNPRAGFLSPLDDPEPTSRIQPNPAWCAVWHEKC